MIFTNHWLLVLEDSTSDTNSTSITRHFSRFKTSRTQVKLNCASGHLCSLKPEQVNRTSLGRFKNLVKIIFECSISLYKLWFHSCYSKASQEPPHLRPQFGCTISFSSMFNLTTVTTFHVRLPFVAERVVSHDRLYCHNDGYSVKMFTISKLTTCEIFNHEQPKLQKK